MTSFTYACERCGDPVDMKREEYDRLPAGRMLPWKLGKKVLCVWCKQAAKRVRAT